MTNSILDAYLWSAPCRQNIIDMFQGEWSSAMPKGSDLNAEPGTARLFEDPRIVWAEKTLGGFAGSRILELGPLEGGHSYMLQKAGARSVLAVEANTRAFLKCLCTKELFGLDRVEFLLGDLVAYLNEERSTFDAVIASGVLYHMTDPIDLIKKLAATTDRLFIWSHYYDQGLIQAAAHLRPLFEEPLTLTVDGLAVRVARKRYDTALQWKGFCGGSAPYAVWMSRTAILDILKIAGLGRIEMAFDQPDHPNGPAIAICAMR